MRNLFRFTDSDAFIGIGADDHCITLMKLLHFWGDREYARVLAGESRKVRDAVISALDYNGSYPDWDAEHFPLTYRLGKHPYETDSQN